MDRAIRLYVPLRRDEVARLVAIADSERRRPADQAAVMLSEALAQRGEQTNEQEASLT
jgi:hypothetical protein